MQTEKPQKLDQLHGLEPATFPPTNPQTLVGKYSDPSSASCL